MVKRSFDFICSLIGFIILSPVFIILCILVATTSKGGVFFRGVRVGKKGKQFRIYKFRSMKPDCEGKGNWNVGDKDPRITKIGHFLRKSKLDELPQLLNVIKGDISLVGARPELQYYVDMYIEEEKAILDLKPGITDWASLVNMEQYKGFTASKNSDEYYLKYVRPLKIKLQLYYRYNNSFIGDIECILWTFFKIIFRSKKIPKKIQQIVDDYNNILDERKQNND